MIVTKSTVQKLLISGVPNQDNISVIVENFGPGAGKITITCFNDCWSNFWGAMGEGNTMETFFIGCDAPYLIGKFSSRLDSEVNDEDEDALTRALRVQIVKDRRNGDIDRSAARDLWDDTNCPTSSSGHADPDIFERVFGDEWWHSLPKKPNANYEHLCRIIKTVKEAFKQLGEEK